MEPLQINTGWGVEDWEHQIISAIIKNKNLLFEALKRVIAHDKLGIGKCHCKESPCSGFLESWGRDNFYAHYAIIFEEDPRLDYGMIYDYIESLGYPTSGINEILFEIIHILKMQYNHYLKKKELPIDWIKKDFESRETLCDADFITDELATNGILKKLIDILITQGADIKDS